MNINIIKYDFKQIGRDPMLIISFSVPVILWILMEFIYPLITEFAVTKFHVEIHSFYPHISTFFLMLIPMMLGMVYGFILLDERDGGIISAISVTPMGKGGYLLLRMSLPVLYSSICILAYSYLLNVSPHLNIVQHLLLALVLSLNAPIMLLFLGAFASNKVEGMAISKAFGLFIIAVPIGLFAPPPYIWLGAYSPMFWVAKAYFAETVSQFLIFFSVGLFVHMVLLVLLLSKFKKRGEI